MTLVFHPLAERELIAAARFYETHASGLDLADRLVKAAQRLQAGLSQIGKDDVALFTEQLRQDQRHK